MSDLIIELMDRWDYTLDDARERVMEDGYWITHENELIIADRQSHAELALEWLGENYSDIGMDEAEWDRMLNEYGVIIYMMQKFNWIRVFIDGVDLWGFTRSNLRRLGDVLMDLGVQGGEMFIWDASVNATYKQVSVDDIILGKPSQIRKQYRRP